MEGGVSDQELVSALAHRLFWASARWGREVCGPTYLPSRMHGKPPPIKLLVLSTTP